MPLAAEEASEYRVEAPTREQSSIKNVDPGLLAEIQTSRGQWLSRPVSVRDMLHQLHRLVRMPLSPAALAADAMLRQPPPLKAWSRCTPGAAGDG